MDYTTFEQLFDDVTADFPRQYLLGLHGWFLREEVQRDPVEPGLYRLGEYIRDPRGLGDHIVLYYGSFVAVYGHLPPSRMRKKIFDTFAHEVFHHLEHQAGRDQLGDDDRRYLEEYQQAMGRVQDPLPRMKREALIVVSLLLGIIAVIYGLLHWAGY